MSKIACFVFCAVAMSSVYAAISEEEKNAFREAIKPIIAECSSEYGVSTDELKAAHAASNPDGIKPCFMGCVFKKAGIFNSEGKFDLEAGIEKLKQFVKDADDVNKLSDIGKQCASVNDEPVSDGDAGCERAKLFVTCAIEHKAEFPL